MAIFIVEFLQMFMVLLAFLQSKHLRSKALFLLKILQSLLMLALMILVMMFAFNRDEDQRSKSLQNSGVFLLIVMYIFEFCFLLYNLVKHSLVFSEHLRVGIKLKKQGELHIDYLRVLVENVFFYYISETEQEEKKKLKLESLK